MAKIRDGSTYLSHHLAANDYYCEKETISGQWQGRGAEMLNLNGDIHAGDTAFERLRNNRHPETGEKLTPRDGDGRVRFFDFQCSAQKSVSIMAVTMGDSRLIGAHDQAARIAFAELERFAATQANSALTRNNRLTGNVVAAVFRHTASRALDPQVHTHHVIANATWDEKSNSWRALTEFEMVRAIRYAGKVYQNEMAKACLQLGYSIDIAQDDKGHTTGFEISGISAELRERFSKRRAEVEQGIEDFRQKHGRMPTTAEVHQITCDSRNAKLTEITTPEVIQAQRRQLSPAEATTLEGLKTVAQRRENAQLHEPGFARESECLRLAASHLYERKSVCAGHELLAEALNMELGRIHLPDLKAKAEDSRLIKVNDSPWLQAALVSERGLKMEAWAIDYIARTQGLHMPLAQVDRSRLPRLSESQAQALQDLLASTDQVVCLRGAAGVGKTTMVQSMHPLLESPEHAVFYCAPTSSAAQTMRDDGMSNATTVSDFIQNVSVRDHKLLDHGIFVVDEAGLASNSQGAQILRLAEKHQARVIFLGDSQQHTSVEQGDFLRILETFAPLHKVELTDIRRQRSTDYRDAIKLMAMGACKAGMQRIDDMGCIKEGKADYIRNAVEDFLTKIPETGDLSRVLAVTPTWAENHAFSAHLRDGLKSKSILGSGELVRLSESLQWTKAQKATPSRYQLGMVVKIGSRTDGLKTGKEYEVARVDDRNVWLATPGGEQKLPLRKGSFDVLRIKAQEICEGERLLVLSNDRHQGLTNGELINVRKISSGIITTTDGREIDTQTFSTLCYGYAVTSHKSQSKTVEHVVVAAERLDAKSAYVACSRGRASCSVHTPDRLHLLSHLPDGNRTAALEALGASKQPPSRNERPDAPPSKSNHRTTERWIMADWLKDMTQGLRELCQRLIPGHSVDVSAQGRGARERT